MRILWLFICLTSTTLSAQTEYQQDLTFSKNNPSRSLIAVGITDINGDKRDDIIRVKDGKEIEVLYLDDHGHIQSVVSNTVDVSESWSLAIANLTNDLRSEIVLSRAFDDSFILKANAAQQIEQKQQIENQAYSQSTSIADINNDGWLDVFVASDDSRSLILRNDGTGNLIKDETLIDLATKIPSDDSGNYGSEWADVDSDGDLDLYLSKCKAGVSNPNDPRRINMLFVNDGQNNYTENAAAFGLNFGQQSWASNFGDLDNDGDLDAIVVHHEATHSLLENIDNQFVDRSDAISNLLSFAYQVVMRDFDNNGYQDILITGGKDVMLWNHGGFNFEMQASPFIHYNMISLAVGDVNRDGFLDVLGVYGGNSLNSPGVVSDALWLAKPNENHFVNFALKGNKSNESGVGARVVIYGAWGTQTREVKAGESYSISNSLNVHFGLAQWDKIDKVEVHWPSGELDVHRNIQADQFYLLNEGSCISPIKKAEQSRLMCEGETVQLKSNSSTTMWQDEFIGEEYAVKEEGVYFSLSNDFGCLQLGESNYIREYDEELIQLPSSAMNCNGEAFSIQFTNEFGKPDQLELSSNENKASIPTVCGLSTATISLVSLQAEDPVVDQQIYQKGDEVVIPSTNGTNWNWYFNEDSSVPFYRGNSLVVNDIDSDRTYFVESETSASYESFNGGELAPSGSNMYSSDLVHGRMFFHVHKEVIMEECSVYTDKPGIRTFTIIDESGQLIVEKQLDLVEGFNKIEFNATLHPGNNYSIGTDVEMNRQNFDHPSPRLVRTTEQTNYPYFVDDLVTIVNSSIGPAFYLYFYDWKVRQTDFICKSDRVAIEINVDTSTSVDSEFTDGAVQLFPNPTSGQINISYPEEYQLQSIAVFNLMGQQVLKTKAQSTVSLDYLSSGHYIAELKFVDRTVRAQIIVTD